MANTYQDTSGKYFATREEAASSNTLMGTNPQASTYDPNKPINSADLNTPAPINLPPTPPAPNTNNLTAGINETGSNLKTDSETERIKAESAASAREISDLTKSIGITQGKESDYIQQEGGYEAKKEYDKFQSQLEAEQLRLRREIEKLDTSGMTASSSAGEKARLERQSLSTQADIAILGNAAARRYDTAVSIAKNKVEIELAPMKAELEGLKYIQENNKQFQTAEFTALLNRKEKEYDKEQDKLQTIENIKIEAAKNGLKEFSAFSNVKTVDEALEAAGSYLYSPNTSITKLENGNTVVVDNRTGQIVNNLGGAKGKITGTGSDQFSSLIKTTASLEKSVAGKEQIANDLTQYLNDGDYNSAYNQIANTVSSSLSAEISTRFDNARIDTEVLTTFRNALEEYEAGGGDIGLLKGTAENISRKLLGVTGDPALTALAVQLEREFQSYRQAMTGAAFTPQESREYAAVNPTANKSFDLNYAVIDGALKQLNNRVNGTIKAMVPQATDIINLIDIPKTTEEADKKIESIYLNADNETASVIDKLLGTNQYSSMDILEYLRTKGVTK